MRFNRDMIDAAGELACGVKIPLDPLANRFSLFAMVEVVGAATLVDRYAAYSIHLHVAGGPIVRASRMPLWRNLSAHPISSRG